jgi:hypothetical protein
MAGKKKNLSDPGRFQVTVPKDTFDYLTALAKRGRLGSTEPEVAAHLVVRAVDEMLRGGYHDLRYRDD